MISEKLDRNRITVTLLSILTVVAVGFVLKQAQSVVLPLIIAWLLSYILSPAITFMSRYKVPRALAVFMVIMFLFGVCYVGGVFLHGRISTLAAAFPKYQESFMELMSALEKRFNVAYNPLTDVDWGKVVGGYLVTLSGSLFSFFSNLVLVIIFLIFIFAGQPYFKFKLRKALSSEYADHMATMVTSISAQISHYLSLQFLISAVTGSVVWGALTIIGVDFAATWGALAFFLNFIPTVGSILASIPPIFIAFIQYYPSVWPGFVTCSGRQHSIDHRQRDCAESPGRSFEPEPGSGALVIALLGVVVGCGGSVARHSHDCGDQDRMRKFFRSPSYQYYDWIRKGLSTGI